MPTASSAPSKSGRVRDAVEKYKRHHAALAGITDSGDATECFPLARVKGRDALRRAARQFFSIFPILIAVIFLVGLFQAFLPRRVLLTLFSGNTFRDTVWGACAGSIVTGNPINSYVIGETLLNLGVSLFGVTALMLSWVSVGLVQLPAGPESKAFCYRRWPALFPWGLFRMVPVSQSTPR